MKWIERPLTDAERQQFDRDLATVAPYLIPLAVFTPTPRQQRRKPKKRRRT
jgi:hypothetical protein